MLILSLKSIITTILTCSRWAGRRNQLLCLCILYKSISCLCLCNFMPSFEFPSSFQGLLRLPKDPDGSLRLPEWPCQLLLKNLNSLFVFCENIRRVLSHIEWSNLSGGWLEIDWEHKTNGTICILMYQWRVLSLCLFAFSLWILSILASILLRVASMCMMVMVN